MAGEQKPEVKEGERRLAELSGQATPMVRGEEPSQPGLSPCLVVAAAVVLLIPAAQVTLAGKRRLGPALVAVMAGHVVQRAFIMWSYCTTSLRYILPRSASSLHAATRGRLVSDWCTVRPCTVQLR